MSQTAASYVKCDLCGAGSGTRILEKEGRCYEQCPQCGFIYTNPRASDPASENAEAFEERLEKYIEKSFAAKTQRIYRSKLRQFQPYRVTNRLLEIGANVGGFLYQARQQEWEPVGVEPVEACADYGRRTHGLNIIPRTLEQAGLPSDHFDVVYSNAVFEHLASPSRVLQEVHRVLRPGGVVYIDTVNYDSYTQRLIGAGWKLLDPRAHLSLFTPTTLPQFCEQARLVVLRVSTHGVRLRPNESGKPHGLDRAREMLLKFPLSAWCRVTLKGDSIAVLAQKPGSPTPR